MLPAALPLDPVPANADTATVAAIQGNVPRARGSLAEQLQNDWVVTLNHVAATDNLAAKVAAGKAPKPDLVIWPENSTDIDPMLDPSVYNEIASAAAAIGRPILVGAVLQNPELNAGVLWLPGQGPTTIYAKRRLVPFGEYIPFRSLISKITSLTQLQPIPFVPGRKTVIFNVGQIRLGDIICYEVGFDDLVRSEVVAGANLLSMQSNDATFERRGPDHGRERSAARDGQDQGGRVRPGGRGRVHHRLQRDRRAGRPAHLAQRHVDAGRTRGARPAAHPRDAWPSGWAPGRSGRSSRRPRSPSASPSARRASPGGSVAAWPHRRSRLIPIRQRHGPERASRIKWAVPRYPPSASRRASNARRRTGNTGRTRYRARQPNRTPHPHSAHGRGRPAGGRVPVRHAGRDPAQPHRGREQARHRGRQVPRDLPRARRQDVNPASGITVTAVHGGKITNVTVKTCER